jgi:hypothetical protein
MKISQFKTNTQKEVDGVWVDLGQGARIKVARLGNPKYKAYFSKATKPYRHQLRAGTLSDEVAERILAECMAETVLLGWEGLEDESGNAIEYNTENAVEVLSIKDFRDVVYAYADEMALFTEGEREEAVKN